jgi:hypothetical protein
MKFEIKHRIFSKKVHSNHTKYFSRNRNLSLFTNMIPISLFQNRYQNILNNGSHGPILLSDSFKEELSGWEPNQRTRRVD